MTNLIRVGLIGAACLTLGAASARAENWDMPTPYADGIFHTQNIAEFAADVGEATDGDVTITVHSANSLFGHAEIRDAVRDGLVPIGEFLLSRLANEDPIFALDSIPFLASSYEESEALWAASREAVSAKLAEQGLTLLYAVPWPGQSLYLKQEITDPAQLQGLNFRAYNVATERLATLVGATPTQVEETDVATAFSTGRVEAMITSPSTGANAKAWDFVSNFIDVQAWLPKNVVVVNTDMFDALNQEDRDAILAAAAAAETRGWDLSRAENDQKIAELEAGGMVVSQPSEALAAKLQEVGATMTAEWEQQAGDEGRAVVEAYRNR
ncbi:TRAP-type C4-dicarboxylate transport system, substrate-binding protein [Aureimonas altamirensis DSM 21988]|uniref:TRAP-type C4-dicarboxylate transport system, substrate-binding protein n=2 Tax=Aureimonas altamirensis TaxID=370622 RepID=A0ABY1ILV5_9HYPH|nr:TRAP transporter substrate-binding protein [Aureimonas altamirensis]BAT26205.1 probable DctP periplasmic C4-dicarboxylatebinding protein [Aureimonas altamirensis]SHJ40755.1 TRAP-type C4-dicarboxylate transport system, substrate-binding protein [Aureimonas altamirensis DSM 21988]